MKNVLKFGSLILAFVLSANFVQAQHKVGYLNSTAILALMPEMKAAEVELSASKAQYEKKGQEMIKALQDSFQVVQKQMTDGVLSPKQQKIAGENLQKKEKSIAEYEQKMILDLQQKEAQLLEPILSKLQTAINEVATAGQYNYVLNDIPGAGSIILFKQPENNLTEAVIKKLNLTIPKAANPASSAGQPSGQ